MKVILQAIFTVNYKISKILQKSLTNTGIQIRDTVFWFIAVYRFLTMSFKKKFWININIFHVNSDTENRDNTLGTVVKIIRKRVSVLRHNASLRRRHLSNRCFNMEIQNFCVIKARMWYDENVNKHKVGEHSKGQS